MRTKIIRLMFMVAFCLIAIFLSSIIISGMTHFGATYYSSGFLGTTGNSKVWFSPSIETPEDNDCNLIPGKHVKRCWTRLKSTSGADTGYLYSDTALSTSSSGLYEVKGSIGCSPFYVVTHTWGWNYF